MESLYVIPQVLGPEQLAQVHSSLAGDVFTDGKASAAGMAKAVKNNEQVDAAKVPGLMQMLQGAVLGHALFRQLAMPRAVSKLMVSRYREGMEYGTHTDAAIMDTGHRSDISFTLFLSEPESYDGGELAMETPFGEQRLKLKAGSLILYPTGGLHRVTPVTRGERLAVVGWVESRVRDARQREILLDLDQVRKAYLDKVGHDRMADLLLKSSTNLRRMWDD
ncbi:Fe2+-dependent dioxygenase [Acidovorax sp. JG5]|uniref:Fe2+-dependent dioxygenase n=1 Tax=Acidovorax sp. JG5 TaxID=2822718 RepID=UPI001B3250FA|nr:Fe2+-dependent dioxygenase [Acidovorax sp. JG5]MBP3979787.1 Fe2+-dependent dioxygenase [Acidovorax sp. JG5]